MPTMLILTCPLCGLRYSSRPLLELHIREDHRPRRRAQPGTRDAGGNPSSRHSDRSRRRVRRPEARLQPQAAPRCRCHLRWPTRHRR
jgi:hypothetical protein